jgi:hypothetical protein
MKFEIFSRVALLSIVSLGLAACATKTVRVEVKAPRHVCEEYTAHTAGLKAGLQHALPDYDYAKTNNCSYDENDINKQYLAGYQSGRQMK